MAWSKAKAATLGAAAVIILCGAVTIWINSGAFGHRKDGSGTVAALSSLPGIYTNGINDAHRLADPLYTYPAGDETTRDYIEALFKRFHPELDPARALKSDLELTGEDIQSRTIFIYGSPENHRFFREIRSQLPLVFENDGIVVGKKKCMGRDVGAIFVCPNPLNPSHRLVVYGTVSPDSLVNMNGVFHGPTDYVVFNDTTRKFDADPSDCFLLLGAFDKTDPSHWIVNERLQLLPPAALQRATAGAIVSL